MLNQYAEYEALSLSDSTASEHQTLADQTKDACMTGGQNVSQEKSTLRQRKGRAPRTVTSHVIM